MDKKGFFHLKQKFDFGLCINCFFFRRVTHYVVVKRDLTAVERDSQIQQMHQELQKVSLNDQTVVKFVYFKCLRDYNNIYSVSISF